MPLYFDEGFEEQTPVYHIGDLCLGQTIMGPALVVDPNCSVVLPPACLLQLTPAGDLEVTVSNAVAS